MMKTNKKLIVSVVAVLAILLVGWGIIEVLDEMDVVESIVHLDVNPSIELQVDDDAEVVRAVALNQDAEKVLEGMKLKDTDVDTAVNAIVGSLLKHGYVDEVANSILLSVEDENTVRGEKLKEELTAEINAILGATSINAAVLAQQVEDAGVAEMADELDISKGKATLIQNILEVNSTYKAKDLAGLSVNELNLILSNPKNEVADVTSTGSANDSAYIGRDKAKEVAFAHAGVAASDTREVEVDFDYEYGKMVYEVDFASAEFEYEYTIDAKTGEVLHSHREYDDDYVKVEVKDSTANKNTVNNNTASNNTTNTTTSSSSAVTDIGQEKAKAIAFKHAGTTEANVTRLTVEREYDDGKLEYHVDFNIGNKEHDYEISAETGKILDYDVDVEGKKTTTSSSSATENTKPATTPSEAPTTTTEPTVTDIGKEKAKSIALANAGFSESQVTRLHVERDLDDGRIEYSVEFTADGKEYDYEISGSNGKILDYDVEREDND